MSSAYKDEGRVKIRVVSSVFKLLNDRIKKFKHFDKLAVILFEFSK
jgi:hypothetical protein